MLAGAHSDTVDGSPGADDNASGVAALVEQRFGSPPIDLFEILRHPLTKGERIVFDFLMAGFM
jgi:hypothetical protein